MNYKINRQICAFKISVCVLWVIPKWISISENLDLKILVLEYKKTFLESKIYPRDKKDQEQNKFRNSILTQRSALKRTWDWLYKHFYFT